MNPLQEIYNAFDGSAQTYEQEAVIQKEIGQRLFERLDYIKLQPRRILDLGCGSGYFSAQLKKKYPRAQLVSLDLSLAMLAANRQHQGWFKRWNLLAADMNHLPFAEQSFDLIFANQVIHWSMDFPSLWRELNRVSTLDACFMFSTLGPDTFQELRQAWSGVDGYAHTNQFADMHDIGDWLVQAQWLDPVVDMEKLSLHYPSVSALLKALKAQGVKNINPQRPAGLMGRRRWQQFNAALTALATPTGKIPLTYEVVYGQAWKGQLKQYREGQDTFVPLSQLRRK